VVNVMDASRDVRFNRDVDEIKGSVTHTVRPMMLHLIVVVSEFPVASMVPMLLTILLRSCQVLCVPILDGKRSVLGVLLVTNKLDGTAFTATDEDMMRELASHLTAVLIR
jgi:GAF domain-containing protein